jgi:AcrR family transcriptional regulator
MQKSRTPSLLIGAEVVGAAVAILDMDGPDGFTVRAIAKRANVAPMAIYNHFGGVNGLIDQLWIQGFSMLREAISHRNDDVDVEFMSAGLGYRRFALDNRGLYTIMFLHQFRNYEPSPESELVAAGTFDALVGIVERAQSVNRVGGGSASDAAQIIWSACHGYVSLELNRVNFAHDANDAYLKLLETLRRGLR